MQLDNPTHTNRKKERIRALQVLEEVKLLNKKVTFFTKRLQC